MSKSGTASAVVYRLRGKIQGVERSFLLSEGENRVGSLEANNDVVLPVRGVSRHHALLTVGPEGLTIEDLASKNGTYVNEQRVRNGPVTSGDELRFGPAQLILEEIDQSDATLAIAVQPSPPSASPPYAPVLQTGETTHLGLRDPEMLGVRWLTFLERFVDRLFAVPEGDLGGALRLLARESEVQGACVFEWTSEDKPVVLAAWGDFESLLARGELWQLFRDVAEEAPPQPVCRVASFDSGPPLVCGMLAGSGSDPLGTVLWGGAAGRADHRLLLPILVRLFDRIRPRSVHELSQGRAHPQVPGLVFPPGYVPGESVAMSGMHKELRPLLQGNLPVLLEGETGVGKELVAKLIHASSTRAAGPFVAINCAAIPAELLESEMFGIAKGVATGVVERVGKFQQAQGGTLFLDEIGEMSRDLQAKLLRALQEKEIHPVGSRPIPVDVRVVAATNAELLKAIDEGRFRRDLYYRIAGYVVKVPPLRRRREDIPQLVEHFIRSFTQEIGKSIPGITVKALQVLVDYPWPGNVRELEHEMRRLVYLCPAGQPIDSSMLSDHILSAPAATDLLLDEEGLATFNLEEHVQQVERRVIRQALSEAQGNRTRAAKLLGISRNGLAIKIERLGIEV